MYLAACKVEFQTIQSVVFTADVFQFLTKAMEMIPVFPAFPVFLEKKRGKSGKKVVR